MKFKIYGVQERGTKTFFRLVYDNDDDDIDLVACDANGEAVHNGLILSIKPSGDIVLWPHVPNTLGLSLDSSSRVNIIYA